MFSSILFDIKGMVCIFEGLKGVRLVDFVYIIFEEEKISTFGIDLGKRVGRNGTDLRSKQTNIGWSDSCQTNDYVYYKPLTRRCPSRGNGGGLFVFFSTFENYLCTSTMVRISNF